LPKEKNPPDKLLKYEEESEITDMKIENGNDEVMDIDRFEKRMLAKPSNVSSPQSARNMKSLIQGKYCFNSHSFESVTVIVPWVNGSSSKSSHPFIKNESIKNHDTVFCPLRVNYPLPPLHNFSPIQNPSKLHLKDIHMKIWDLLQLETPISQPDIKFDTSLEAADFNWKLLSSNNFDLESILNHGSRSIMSYGSEFKTSHELETLLQFHPRWPALKSKLDKGSLFPLSSMSEQDRKLDLESAYKRGNHKSALKNSEFLANAIKKETKKG
jgi:hypothetical protein